MTDHLHVITGGPGSGKSSLLIVLAEAGFACVSEAGRTIIRDQAAIGGAAMPWRDRALFAEIMLSWEMRAHREASALAGPVLFDRGIVDVMATYRVAGLEVPRHVRSAAEHFRYNRRVFIAPYWPDIYEQDSERLQSADEAERSYAALHSVYAELGYELIELPRAGLPERVAFVRERLQAST